MLRSKIVYSFIFIPVLIFFIYSPDTRRDFYTVSITRHISALLFVLVASFGALRKKSVAPTAVPLVCIFGYIIAIISGVYAASLLGFLILGSSITKVGAKIKQNVEIDYKPEGQRRWTQVVSNCGVIVLLCVMTMGTIGHGEAPVDFKPFFSGSYGQPSMKSLLSSHFHLAVLGAVACCCGDTFASELGTAYSGQPPVLITKPWRRVPVGTNGGITLIGLLASGLGGFAMGVIHYLFTVFFCHSSSASYQDLLMSQWPLVVIGMLCGLSGGLIDSLLGATLQFSGVIHRTHKVTDHPGPNVKPIAGIAALDNDLVNFVSSLITAVVTPLVAASTVL